MRLEEFSGHHRHGSHSVTYHWFLFVIADVALIRDRWFTILYKAVNYLGLRAIGFGNLATTKRHSSYGIYFRCCPPCVATHHMIALADVMNG